MIIAPIIQHGTWHDTFVPMLYDLLGRAIDKSAFHVDSYLQFVWLVDFVIVFEVSYLDV